MNTIKFVISVSIVLVSADLLFHQIDAMTWDELMGEKDIEKPTTQEEMDRRMEQTWNTTQQIEQNPIQTNVNFTNETAHGQSNSDVYLEGNVIAADPDISYSVPELNITKFEIQANSSSYKEMCPSLRCKIYDRDQSASFIAPDTPESRLISAEFGFRLQDDITHADLGPKKKELVEEYKASIDCHVVDIVEKNGQELYYCGPTLSAPIGSSIYNTFNSSDILYRNLDIAGTYDAKNGMLKLSGNFTGNDVRRTMK